MTMIFADTALLPEGWVSDVRIEINAEGRIGSIERNAISSADDKQVGILLPAPVNAHSHAFQRAMAGLTEKRGPDPNDSFWTWRQLMYRFLDQLKPEDIEAITAFVQMEMLEAGYATNVEFHYIHHQPGGVPYDNLAELSDRVIAATQKSGIGLTLLPVHYQYGGCDKRTLGPGQIRFGNDFERFVQLAESAGNSLANGAQDCVLGVAPHSLRAVAPEDLQALYQLLPDRPIHLHLAEQVAEVDEVQAYWGKRPVEWVLENLELDERWCMIHCTQMLPHETEALAKSGAIAGLCPITESSLGDGIFDGVNWFDHGGKIAIGSDSNIRISLSEEIRTLDYSQRLRDRSRAALANQNHSTGRRIFDAMCDGGAIAAGRNTGRIEQGFWADLMTLDHASPDIVGRSGDVILDSFTFAGDDRLVHDVWSAGRYLVQNGRHIAREKIVQAYKQAIKRLGDEI
ncbi:MAG: formimidoylglutamate deiminase [Pseudomonadota bacterium]